MTSPPVRPDSPDWHQGYQDGYLDLPPLPNPTPDYKDGWTTGNAERDAPITMVDPVLWARRHGS